MASSSCAESYHDKAVYVMQQENVKNNAGNQKSVDTAIFAAGCFWCVEAQFLALKGVHSVQSGYIGGSVANPSYKEVCTGNTGHAEAVRISYDPAVITYDELLMAFFVSHDPTQLNRQGADVGTQYRSAIFPMDEVQRERSQYYINKLNQEGAYDSPIVTTIEPIAPFYEAEDYHNNYFELNPDNPYCNAVVKPKVEKFKKVFKQQIKQ